MVRHILTDGWHQVWDVKHRNLQESLANAGLLLQMFKSRKNQTASRWLRLYDITKVFQKFDAKLGAKIDEDKTAQFFGAVTDSNRKITIQA